MPACRYPRKAALALDSQIETYQSNKYNTQIKQFGDDSNLHIFFHHPFVPPMRFPMFFQISHADPAKIVNGLLMAAARMLGDKEHPDGLDI